MPAPELSVVCKSCGSEVSPYVTECPYCGQRLRKRAPKLEREGDEIRVQESRRDRRRRRRTERSIRTVDLDARPLATAATILIGAVLIVLGRSVPLNIYELGAIVGPVGSDLWRYVTAPFVYDDIGYFLVVALAIGVFGASVERRLGSLATGTLILATGTLGMLAAGAADSAG
ncbi:MAG: rhomboid family intramembrane serine protease [Solirubrobacterales bacterium]|nr:rhomboid family intramembrane serine protease [Solirubrobacterales bacterium]